MWLIEHMHAGAMDPGLISERWSDRPALGALIRATDRPRLYRAAHTGLDAAVLAAGRVRAWWVERKLASLLGHVERRRGEYEQSRRTPRPARWVPA